MYVDQLDAIPQTLKTTRITVCEHVPKKKKKKICFMNAI